MRYLAVSLSLPVLVACSTAPATHGKSQSQETATNAPVEFLLASAVTDFHTHRPPYLARFRDVRIGYLMTSDGTRQYMLCGSFLAESGKLEWTPFVTIKTSGYEQWLGAQAVSFCERSPSVWGEGDFSPSLQRRIDSLR